MAAAAPLATLPKTVVFFHPDLGIGGAERLVVDAAVGLQNRGHRVVVFTSHRDPAHCFDEARPRADGGVLDVRVRGGSVVPPTVLGRFAIVCAIARQVHLLLQVWLTGELAALDPSAYVVDQLSAGLPLLRAVGGRVRVGGGTDGGTDGGTTATPILFYCHFPDLLLAHGRQAWWKRLYRVPFDALEQWSMGFADAVAVNSRFTKSVVTATWPRLAAATEAATAAAREATAAAAAVTAAGRSPPTHDTDKNNKDKRAAEDDGGLRVVYPCIDLRQEAAAASGTSDAPVDLWKGLPFVLSINRFERKKDIGLAIRAFAGLPADKKERARLVVAGGYDHRVAENVQYHRELDALAAGLGLRTATARTMVTALGVPADVQVLFLLSVPSALKALLLHSPSCRLLAYTPANEHFGIVPLEAMLAGLPVLACDSGGPTETVVDGQTGWLRPADDLAAWSDVMRHVLPSAPSDASPTLSDTQRRAMADAGRARVRTQFADTQMAARLDAILDDIIAAAAAGHPAAPAASSNLPVSFGALVMVLSALAALALALALAVFQRLS